MKIEIKVPGLGDGVDQVDVAAVEVAEGASVGADDTLVTLETDKAAMDIPADIAGTVVQILVKAGDKLAEGDLIAVVDSEQAEESAESDAPESDSQDSETEKSEAAETEPAEPVAEENDEPTPVADRPTPPAKAETPAPDAGSSTSSAHASPAVRQFARELGADLGAINGSGRKGRITRSDVTAFVKGLLTSGGGRGAGLEPLPDYDHSQWGETELLSLSRIRQLTAKNLSRSWPQIPQVTQFDESDITELEAFRQAQKSLADQQEVKLTLLALVMKAVVHSLRSFPDFNSSLHADGEQLVLKKYFHIGVAVETEAGLVVPVVRDVDQKGIFEIAAALGDLSGRARQRKLKPDEMQGSSFTISSLGGIGGTAFTPVVNHPNVAILGLSRSQMKPVWDGSEFQPRLMLPLSLSYDHRVIDGAVAARFTRHLADNLADIRRVLL